MDRELFETALAIRQNAYAPYSKFLVGAALRTEAGSIRAGCNVENAAHPLACCAEASAIAVMIAASSSAADRRISALCVVTEAVGGKPATPCGGCRQRIAEFAAPDAKIHVAGLDGNGQTYRLAGLLPAIFSIEPPP